MERTIFSKLLVYAFFFLSFNASAQDTTTVSNDSTQGNYFLSFVKKVYFNPTVFLKCQSFRQNNNVQVLVLPDLNGSSQNQIKGFEKAFQSIIRFLINGDDLGAVRFYFNADSPSAPFTFVYDEALHCKFRPQDNDSITARLNAPFATAGWDINQSILFETAIEDALAYVAQRLQAVPGECGEVPTNETTEINTKPLEIDVYNTSGSQYDIDRMQYIGLESHYAKAYNIFTQQDWYAPAKLMVSGGSADEPIAISIDKHETVFKKNNLQFRSLYNNQIIPIESNSTNDTVYLKLPKAFPTGNPVEVVAKYESTVDSTIYTVGFFMVHVYDPKPVTVNVIGVNGFVLDATKKAAIQSELDKIYGPVGVNFNVVEKTLIPESHWANVITIQSSGLLSNYTHELRKWTRGVKELPDYNSDELYLIFGLNCSQTDYNGYMPRARNIGFVFAGANQIAQVAAHELGHGKYHLRHLFDDAELGESSKKTTKNIMDYGDETKPLIDLYLHQWNFIDDPGFVSWFSDDEDALSVTVGLTAEIFNKFKNTDGSLTFLSPAGKPISIPSTATKISTSLPDDQWVISYGDASVPVESHLTPVGSLLSFYIGDTLFNARASSASSNTFYGYKNEITNEYYEESISKNLINFIPILVTPIFNQNGFGVNISQSTKQKSDFTSIPSTNKGGGVELHLYELFSWVTPTLLSEGIVTAVVEFETVFSQSTLGSLASLVATNGANEANNLSNVVTQPSVANLSFEYRALDATILYVAATLIEQSTAYSECLSSLDAMVSSGAFNSIVAENDQEILKSFDQSSTTNPWHVAQDNLKPRIPDINQRVQFFGSIEEAKYAAVRIKKLFLYLKEYNNFATSFINNQISIENKLSTASINLLINVHTGLESKSEGSGDCLLKMLSAQTKIELLKKFSEWCIGDTKEEFLIKVLEHSSVDQFVQMYPIICEDDYKIMRGLAGDTWWSQHDQFSNVLTIRIIEYMEYTTGINLNSLPVFKLYKDNVGIPNAIDNYSTGSLHSDGVDLWTGLNGFNNNISLDDLKPEKMFLFIAKEDFTFSGYNGKMLKKGDSLIAPAYWAQYFLSEHADNAEWFAIRKTIEVALIAATWGTATPVVLAFEVGMAAADFAICVAVDVDPNSQVAKDVQSTFNTIYLVYGAAALTNLALKVNWITAITKGGQKVFKIYKNGFPALLSSIKKSATYKVDDLIDNIGLMIAEVQLSINKGYNSAIPLLGYLKSIQRQTKFSKYYSSVPHGNILVKNNELFLEMTTTLHGVQNGAKIKLANVGDDILENTLMIGNVNRYANVATDGTILVDDIIYFDKIKVANNGNYTNVEYAVVFTSKGKVRMIPKGALDDILNPLGNLAKDLTGMLKSSYDDLVLKGLSVLEESGKIKFLDNNGRFLAEISNGKLSFKYSGFGSDIIITEGKATTVLGKFTEPGNTALGTRYFLGSNSNPIVLGFPNGSINRGVSSATPNRLNFLDLPEPQYNALINTNVKTELEVLLGSSSSVNLTSKSINEVKNVIKTNHPTLTTTEINNIVSTGITKGNNEFWITYNLPFLKQSLQRGDDIRLVSDPDFYKNATDVIGGTYKKELIAIDQLKAQYGYSYYSATKTYYKN